MSNLLMDDSSETESAKSFGSASEIPDEVLGEPIYIERDSKFYKVLKEKGNTIEKPGKIDKVCIAWK